MSTNPITIRSLGPEDAFVLDRVRPGVFDRDLEPARVFSFLATRVNELVVALQQGEVVGFAYGTVLMRLDQPTEFFINEVSVHEDLQRNGVATRMIERLNHLAFDRGCETIWVLADDDNRPARALYKKFRGPDETRCVLSEWNLT